MPCKMAQFCAQQSNSSNSYRMEKGACSQNIEKKKIVDVKMNFGPFSFVFGTFWTCKRQIIELGPKCVDLPVADLPVTLFNEHNRFEKQEHHRLVDARSLERCRSTKVDVLGTRQLGHILLTHITLPTVAGMYHDNHCRQGVQLQNIPNTNATCCIQRVALFPFGDKV